MTTIRTTVLPLIAAAGLAACGGTDRATTVTQVVTSKPSDIPTTTTLSKARAASIAQAALLSLDDMPVGWTAQAKEREARGSDDEKGCAETQGVPRSRGHAATDSFADGDGDVYVDQQVMVYADESEAVRAVNTYRTAAFRNCYEKFLVDRTEATAEGTDVVLEGVDAAELNIEPYGDDSFGLRFEVRTSEYGVVDSYFFDNAVVRAGALVSVLGARAAYSPVAADLRSEILQTVAGRLRSAMR